MSRRKGRREGREREDLPCPGTGESSGRRGGGRAEGSERAESDFSSVKSYPSHWQHEKKTTLRTLAHLEEREPRQTDGTLFYISSFQQVFSVPLLPFRVPPCADQLTENSETPVNTWRDQHRDPLRSVGTPARRAVPLWIVRTADVAG